MSTSSSTSITEFCQLFINSNNEILLTGYTNESGLATSGAIQTSWSCCGDVNSFISKYSNAGTKQWFTYFGSTQNITGKWTVGEDIVQDDNQRILVTGFTNNTYFNLLHPLSSHSSILGWAESYVASFDGSSSGNPTLNWSTYFGGNVDDIGLGITTDECGVTTQFLT